MSIVAVVFLMLPNSVFTASLVRSDSLFSKVTQIRPRLAGWMDIFFHAVGAAVLLVIAYGMWGKFTLAIARNHFTGTPGIFTAPIWPVLLAIIVGGVWAAVNFAAIAISTIQAGRPVVEGGSDDGN